MSHYRSHGLDRGMLYPSSGPGIPWNGLISVEEQEDTSVRTRYYDGEAYRQSRPPGFFAANVRAITFPEELKPMRGQEGLLNQQPRTAFGMAYRTLTEHGYQIHLVYNALLAPASASYETENDTPKVIEYEWSLTTLPMPVPGERSSSHLIIDSTKVYDWVLAELETILYGEEDDQPRLPSPKEIIDIVGRIAVLIITDHGDGTWTAEGPDDVVYMLDSTTFEIDWVSAVYIDEKTYTVRTW